MSYKSSRIRSFTKFKLYGKKSFVSGFSHNNRNPGYRVWGNRSLRFLPQLDIYIVQNLIQSVLLLWCILFLINTYYFLLNIFFSLKITKIKFFVEKQFLKKIFNEKVFVKKNKYLIKTLLIKKNLFLEIKKNLFLEDLLDIFNTNMKILKVILNEKNIKYIVSKNNLEFFRNLQ